MLHIIFLILKILGWILLGILALVLILFGILLLNPVKYKLKGSCDGTIDSLHANLAVRWIFHLITANAEYKDRELKWSFRIAWKKFSSEGEEESEPIKKVAPKAVPEKKSKKADVSVTSPSVSSRSEASSKSEIKTEIKRESKQEVKASSTTVLKENKPKQPRIDNTKKNSRKKQTTPAEKDWLEQLYEKLTNPFRKLIQKIKYTFQKICDKVKVLIRKKERLQAFLTYEIHQNAFSKAVKELKRLLRFLKPKQFIASIEFGFSDPAWTGYMLAFLGMLYPFLGEFTEFYPDFEEKILKGNLYTEGKIRSIYFVIPALNLLLDRNVRITYRHIRKFKL